MLHRTLENVELCLGWFKSTFCGGFLFRSHCTQPHQAANQPSYLADGDPEVKRGSTGSIFPLPSLCSKDLQDCQRCFLDRIVPRSSERESSVWSNPRLRW